MNEEQIIAIVQETFDLISPTYDSEVLRFFSESAKRLPVFLDLRGDERVIDVATGTGHAALAIARHLPNGQVTGVDFSAGMLDQARDKASAIRLGNVNFLEQDMRNLLLEPDSFDLAVCAFGIFFVPDMEAQLSKIVSAVKRGGRVAITSFSEEYFHPLKDMMIDRLGKYGVAQPPQAWKRVATEIGCRALFEQAGLDDIRVEQSNVGYNLATTQDWWEVIWNAGYRRLVNQLSSDDLTRFKQEHLQEVETVKTKSGIWLDVPVLFTIGTKIA